jgi:cytosine/adenosine deaminase-related metal-dependent hydrolase
MGSECGANPAGIGHLNYSSAALPGAVQSFGGRMPENSERRMIVRARIVVTMDGPPIEDGAAAISGNRIIDVGKFSEIKMRNASEVVDLGEGALLPGLINAHCHLDYTCLRGQIPPPKSFTDWIRAINAEKAKLSPEDYVASISEGFAEARQFGTTTIANLTAVPELIAEIDPCIRTWWFAELIDVRAPEQASRLVDSAMESLGRARPPGAPRGLAPHSLFTASIDLYRRCEEVAQHENVSLTTHLAESEEEMAMFCQASGPLYEFMKSIGRPMDDCGCKTPLASFVGAPYASPARTGRALPDRWIIAHLNELSKSDFELLKRSQVKFHLVHSPRSHRYFDHSPFPFERLHRLRFNVCLGTDSLASNENLNLFAEMRAFQQRNPAIAPPKILEMVTLNPALALGQQNALGRIRAGFRADLIAIPCDKGGDLFDEIIAFDGAVDWTMVNGKI